MTDNQSAAFPANAATLIDVLRWRAREQPDRGAYTFLVDGETQEESITYAELDRRARAIAATLQSLPAPVERAVLLLPQGLDYPSAFFGCLYAGVVAVPSAPTTPGKGAAAVERALSASQASLIITTTSIRKALHADLSQAPSLSSVQWLHLDAIAPGAEERWQDPAVTDRTLTYIALTSGSTALPKAILCSHDTLMSFLRFDDLEFTEQSHLVSWMPPHAAFQLIVGMVLPVYRGGQATFMTTGAFLERPARWLQAMSRKRATHTLASNFAFDLCVRAIPPEVRATLDLSSWQLAMNGGEMVRAETIERFTEAFAPCGFRREAWCAIYGMSESMGVMSRAPKGTGPVVGAFRQDALERNRVVAVRPDEDGARVIAGTGRPVAPDYTVIVDPVSLTACEPDQVGEIWVGGPLNRTLGYLDQPEESDRTFNAHLADTGAGPFLRTGDLGFLHDGEVFVVGRVKELIIIRGRNLSPQQIESTAENSHPALRAGGTAAFTVDVDDEERLVVVQEVDPQTPDLADVVAAIRRAVAEEHQITAYAVVLVPPGTVPKTPSGKVQRQPCRTAFLEGRLAAVEQSLLSAGIRPPVETPYAPPRTATERTLANIWARVLGVERVGVEDNFFEIGGDSLTTIEAIGAARRAGLQITIEQFMEQQTIARLAAVAEAAPTVAAEQGIVSGPAPLLPSQQRFFELQDPAQYHIGFYRRVAARQWLDPKLLAAALQYVIAHHDALRMRFRRQGTRWEQTNLPCEEHQTFSYMHVGWMSPDHQDSAIDAVGEQLHYTLDLATGPLVRVTLFDRGRDQPSEIVYCIHHLVMDALSGRIFFEDLETAYLQLSRGETVQLPPKTASHKAFGERLQGYATSAELREELDYWLAEPRSRVAPLPGQPGNKRWGGGQAAWLDPDETNALIYDLPRLYGTEINDVLLTALVRAFADWTGSRSLLVDLISHGRDPIFPDLDVSRTMGWFATFFPVLLDLGDARVPAEELRAIQEQLRRIPRRGLGYGVLRYLSPDEAVKDRLRHLPGPQVRLNYTGMFGRATAASSLFGSGPVSGPPTTPEGRAPVALRQAGLEPELLVQCQVVGGQLQVVMLSGRVVADQDTMERLMRSYLGALRAIIATCAPSPAAARA